MDEWLTNVTRPDQYAADFHLTFQTRYSNGTSRRQMPLVPNIF